MYMIDGIISKREREREQPGMTFHEWKARPDSYTWHMIQSDCLMHDMVDTIPKYKQLSIYLYYTKSNDMKGRIVMIPSSSSDVVRS